MSTTHNYFDLIDYIRNIQNFEVSAQMAQSLAFRIDVNIQSAARQLFKLLREDQAEKLAAGGSSNDSLADLTAALGEQAFAERCFHEIGSSTEGPVETIRDLMALRDEVHEMAAELTAYCLDWQGNARQYEIPDLDARFYERPKLKIKETEARRAAKSVTRRAEAYGLSKEDAEAMLVKKLARKNDKLREVEETLANQGHVVHVMFTLAMSAKLDCTPADSFYTLSIEQQRQMIDACIKAADRAEEYAERNDRMAESEYDDICACVMKVTRDLNGVLRSPRFAAHAASEAAAAQNVG